MAGSPNLYSQLASASVYFGRVRRLSPHTHESRNNAMLWWSKRIAVVSWRSHVCLPQTPSAWADECEEKKRGCHKRSASCGSTDQLKEVRTRLGPDLLSSPVLCSIQQKQDPLVVFISPMWDCRWGDGAATGCWGWWGGEDGGCVIIILLAGSSEPEAAWCHLGLHPPFLLFVCTLPSPVTSSSGFIHCSLYSACLPLFHHFKGLLPPYVSAVHLQCQAFTGVCTCIIFCHSLSQLSSLSRL